MSKEDPQHYLIRASQLLTMPKNPASLSHFHPDLDLDARDRELIGLIEDGAVVVKKGIIDWVGRYEDLKKERNINELTHITTSLLMPGIIDCHTHAVFVGNRSQEFVLRNAGRPYVEILEAGGGILNTVDLVRKASTATLASGLIERVYDSVRHGVTTLEVKSGYGLTVTDERKMLKAVAMAQSEVPCELVPCFLGAHAIPREYRENPEGYVDLVCEEMIPMVVEQRLSSYCDVFCDRGAFNLAQSRRILECGLEHGLIPRLHADELTNIGAAQLSCDVGASSAEHLEHTPKELFAKLAAAGVTPVILPGVNLFLGTTNEHADARAMIAAGCDVAVASDFNPGSSMSQNMPLMTTLACTIHKLTPGEALRGITVAAAKALRRDDIGRLEVGMMADLTMFSVDDYRTIPYHFGESHIAGVVQKGDIVHWVDVDVDHDC